MGADPRRGYAAFLAAFGTAIAAATYAALGRRVLSARAVGFGVAPLAVTVAEYNAGIAYLFLGP